MGSWSLVFCSIVAGLAVLLFLRLVSIEIDLVEKEAEFRRRSEKAKRQRDQEEQAALESAA